ncbi:MAG: ABC transporter ATP-binding protein [Pirellulales bacterium]|nr:ABC transporter ATP-binding protein [Pirellulales bacterium]
MTQPTNAIVCRNVVKEFGSGGAKVRALRGVDLDVPFGELVLLVGESGCGKTTLLSIIASILDPTSGEVQVLGTDITRLWGGRKVRFRGKNIGFVFQQYNLLPSLTACENVAIPLIILGYRRGVALRRAREILAMVGLENRQHALPNELSGGQQQRVAISRALVHDPAIIICDEPTAALDAENGRLVIQLLRQVAVQPNRAVVVVTHDNRIFEFGDRIAHMEDGRVDSVTVQKVEV